MKSCDILSFLNSSCITDYLTEDNQINNINNIKKAIGDNSINFLLDNITKGGNDITIQENNLNIKYHLHGIRIIIMIKIYLISDWENVKIY